MHAAQVCSTLKAVAAVRLEQIIGKYEQLSPYKLYRDAFNSVAGRRAPMLIIVGLTLLLTAVAAWRYGENEKKSPKSAIFNKHAIFMDLGPYTHTQALSQARPWAGPKAFFEESL